MLTELLDAYARAVFSGGGFGKAKPNCCVWCDAELAARAAIEAHVAELSAERDAAVRELDLYKDDAKECEKHCWYCANPDIGDPERHEHEPQGGHWHHYIDPGDGLPSPCKNSDMLERIFKEQAAKVAELEARLAASEAGDG